MFFKRVEIFLGVSFGIINMISIYQDNKTMSRRYTKIILFYSNLYESIKSSDVDLLLSFICKEVPKLTQGMAQRLEGPSTVL